MKVLHLRPMPYLEFQTDESLARGARTLDLLEQLHHDEGTGGKLLPNGGADGGPGPGDRPDSEQ